MRIQRIQFAVAFIYILARISILRFKGITGVVVLAIEA